MVIDWINENIQSVFNNRVQGVVGDLKNIFILRNIQLEVIIQHNTLMMPVEISSFIFY